jgi:hypothetical protein
MKSIQGLHFTVNKSSFMDFGGEAGGVRMGDTEEAAPEKRHCIIAAIPVCTAVDALKNLRRGGKLAINPTRREEFELREAKRVLVE